MESEKVGVLQDTIKIIPPLPRDAKAKKASTRIRLCKCCHTRLHSYNKTQYCCRHSWMQVSSLEYDKRTAEELN